MRQLKFRGWHTKAQKMFSAEELATDQLTLLTTGEFINVHSESTEKSIIYPRDKFIPLQFTGLLDKNGKDIFEGDIVNKEGEFTEDDSICAIEYSELSAMFVRRVDAKCSIGLCITDRRDIEVVGNVYENPELLGGKDE